MLGGAPVNFAIQSHQVLKHHGFQGVAAVRLGNDDLATTAADALQSFGLATQFLQFDPDRPTGTAVVHRDEKGHRFEIVENVCWDHFDWTDRLQELSTQAAVVCFGTLGQRSAQSRHTIRKFIESASQAIRVFDVNIRQHYYDNETILHGCRHASILKLNEDELEIVAMALGVDPTSSAIDCCQKILNTAKLEFVVYTQGELGTTVITENAVVSTSPESCPAAVNADAVGAGDACTAGIVASLLLKLPLEQTVALANRLGAFVASQAGATPELPTALLPDAP